MHTEIKPEDLIEVVPEVIYVEAQGRILYINSAWKTIFGYPLNTSIGKLIDSFIFPKDKEAYKKWRDGINPFSRFNPNIEIRLVSKSGPPVWVDFSGLFWGDVFCGIIKNIDEIKKSQIKKEKEIAAYRKEFEEKNLILEKANFDKLQFMGIISHEIRTPMNAVMGYAQILKSQVDEAEHLKLLARMSESCESLIHIVDDILDVSKMEAGQLKLDKQTFTLRMIQERILDFSGQATQKGLDFSISGLTENEAYFVGDPNRIIQIFNNLIGNAIKFTERGRVEFSCIQLFSTNDSLKYRFDVRDTGIGIPLSRLPDLFKPFNQVDRSVTRRYGGTGLGLAICKKLTELMGGQIFVSSQEGKGSIFSVELRLEKLRERLTPHLGTATPSRSRTANRLLGLRALIVDDNRMNRIMLDKLLRMEGAQTTLTENGQTALDVLRSDLSGFDVVLMDIQMPYLDGLSATREIRSDSRLASVPIVAVSAGVLDEERGAAFEAGVDHFIAKPIRLDTLVGILKPYIH